MRRPLTVILVITIILSFSTPQAFGFVLSNAGTLGQGNSAFASVTSTNKITTDILSAYSTHLENYAFGTIAQYGLFDNLDIMLGFGGISYSLTPDIGLDMLGGNFFGTGIKYNVFDEGEDIPVSLAFLAQYLVIPATLVDMGKKHNGYNYDTYYKLILSRNLSVFFPYVALGLNSRYLKIGDMSSTSTIGQIDIGYGAPITKRMFVGVEINWSTYWHDKVMDSILGTETLNSALGYSFGVQCLL